jgi:predicted transcriptional regulator
VYLSRLLLAYAGTFRADDAREHLVASGSKSALPSAMAKSSKVDFENLPPVENKEDEQTLAAIDEGIRDAKRGRTLPAEDVRKLVLRICGTALLFFGFVDLEAQPTASMHAICFEQVGSSDHSLFPLAISDSEAGAKWCQQEIGLPPRAIPPDVVGPETMARFLAIFRTVSESEQKVPAGYPGYKFVVFQAEGKREITLDRPAAHNVVKRLEQRCRGTQLHEYLSYIVRQLGPPRNN